MTRLADASWQCLVVAGTSLLLRRGDDAPAPVILLHGIGSHAESWQRMLAVLNPTVSAIAWDAPGYGASAPLGMEWPRPADYAARLHAVLDGLALRRVILVGHSLGALFAASFAAACPDRVAALALLSPAIGYGVTPGHKLPDAVQARIDELHRLGAAAFAEKRSPRLVYQPERHPGIVADVGRAMAAVHPAGYVQAVRALGAGDLLADAARITAPTLVAVGADDVVTPPPGARAVFAAVPRPLRLVELAQTGHALPQQAPEAAAGLIEDLLAPAGRTA